MNPSPFTPGATFALIRYRTKGRVEFLKTPDPAIRPAVQHAGNATDAHIHHPKLGQVDTDGNRFAAIVKASDRLHGLQAGERFAVAMRQRAYNAHSMTYLRDLEGQD